MSDANTWKVLFYLCGDAADRLGVTQDAVNLERLLAPLVLPDGASEATILVQAHLHEFGQAVRLVQLPGQTSAAWVATIDNSEDGAATRDTFTEWALRSYPTTHTLLVLRECSAETTAAFGSAAFEVTDAAGAPSYQPLSKEGIDRLGETAASRGLSQWLGQLAAALAGRLGSFFGDVKTEPVEPVHPTPPPPEPPQPDPEPPPSPEPPVREWTILLYMAGDNGATFHSKYGNYSLMAEMTSAGEADITEVEQVGSSESVAILAQFDTLPSKDPLAKELGTTKGGSYRLEIQKGRTVKENIVQILPEVNTGDPAELARFIVWGQERCPSRHTALVLWNHGLGWKDDDIYAKVRSLSRSANRKPRKANAPMFRTTARRINRRASQARSSTARGVLCDDTSMDFLTNQELSQALRVAEFAVDEADVGTIFGDKARLAEVMVPGNEGALRHVHILGMDACLMAMIEVQYQVRQLADIMVASQEVEPMNGWPYQPILVALDERPTMAPAELARLIVDHFVASYLEEGRGVPDVTQSAVDLSRLGETSELLRAFADALVAEIKDDLFLEKAYRDARDFADRDHYAFEDPEYIDLISFLQAMQKGYRGQADKSTAIKAAAALQDWLASSRSPVIASAASGKFKDKAHGMSLYVPRDLPSPLYEELDFKATGWPGAVKKIYQR